MALFWKVDLLFLVLFSLFELGSFGGYSCNCDCGPNAGGGRCSLVLPSLDYLDSPGQCQAIQLDKRRQYCTKNEDTENETVCWGMPRTACMCKEPAGSYNLMCECDGNRGIFCGSEQNNCVCEVLVADKNVAITIGIAVGSTVLGIFVLTFIITIIYFIRKAQQAKDPWYQFDKQFKRFMAIKEREKRTGIRPEQRKVSRPLPPNPTPSKPKDTSITVDATIETQQPLLTTLNQDKDLLDTEEGQNLRTITDTGHLRNISTTSAQRKISRTSSQRNISEAGPNWLLAPKEEGLLENELIAPSLMNNEHVPTKLTQSEPNIYASTLRPFINSNASQDHLVDASSIVQHAAHINHGYEHDTVIYESLN